MRPPPALAAIDDQVSRQGRAHLGQGPGPSRSLIWKRKNWVEQSLGVIIPSTKLSEPVAARPYGGS